jgi:hypothetical protein
VPARPPAHWRRAMRGRGDLWASIGFAGVVVLGWIVEATVKWAVEQAWASLH